MKYNVVIKPLVLAVSTSMLIACSSSGDQASNTTANQTNPVKEPTVEPVVEPIKTQPKALGKHSLKKADNVDAFLSYYTDAMQPQNYEKYELFQTDTVVAAPTTDAVTPPSTDEKQFSTTNLIEAGVDELDYVKQNATHIFSTNTNNVNSESIHNILVYKKPSTTSIAKLTLDKANNFEGLFLNKDELFSLRQVNYNSFSYYDDIANEEKQSDPDSHKAKLALDVISVTTPTSPKVSKTYEWDGEYQNSRRIGNNVYVISNSRLRGFDYCAYPIIADSTFDIRTYCEEPKKLTAQELAERMPVDIKGNKVKPSDCYIPAKYDADSDHLESNITLITKVDLSGNNDHKTTCVAASPQHMYMSTKALYLASDDYEVSAKNYQPKTLINKFNLNDGDVTYAGAGSLDGTISWTNASFSMNEYNDLLRVATSKREDSRLINMVHTLKEADDELTLNNIATIPNKERPAAIGKPNEEMKGIRFFGNQGYVVTFEQTDPLYKIDFTNPEDPKIVGELELPGYSAYLQRINDNYLLGVGFETRTTENNGFSRTTNVGIQTTVFDVSQDNPTIVDQDVINIIPEKGDEAYDPDTYVNFTMPVNRDSRAITTLTGKNSMKVSVPFNVIKNKFGDKTYAFNAKELEIDLTSGKIINNNTRDIVSPFVYDFNKQDNDANKTSLVNSYYANKERGLLDGNDIYYSLSDGSLYKHLWSL